MALPPRDRFSQTANALHASRTPTNVTKSDTELLPFISNGIYVGTGGDVRIHAADAPPDQFTDYKNVADGGYLYVAADKIMEAGTTASDFVVE